MIKPLQHRMFSYAHWNSYQPHFSIINIIYNCHQHDNWTLKDWLYE
jgi:hypothetical protein